MNYCYVLSLLKHIPGKVQWSIARGWAKRNSWRVYTNIPRQTVERDQPKAPGILAVGPFRAVGFLSVSLLLAGCEHTPTSFTSVPLEPAQPVQLSRVALTNRFDPAWLQPSSDLFTL